MSNTENTQSLIISKTDYEKLLPLVNSAGPEVAELLEMELGRATVVEPAEVPNNVVSMNSKVNFIDLDADKEMSVTLVYPHESNIEENKVSVLAPIGAALIGLQVGQTIDWPMPNGKNKRVKVVSVQQMD